MEPGFPAHTGERALVFEGGKMNHPQLFRAAVRPFAVGRLIRERA